MPRLQEHRTARQRERVDLLLVDDVEGVTEFGWWNSAGIAYQTLADTLDIVVDAVVVEKRHARDTSAAASCPTSTSCAGE